MKTVALHTLGCKLNFAETSTIGRQFLQRGFEVVDHDQPADVFVLNTCSVTERADRECRQLVRRALRRSPSAYVVVLGCYAQLQPEEIAAIDGVDLVLGASERFRIFDFAGAFVKQSLPQMFVSCIDEATEFAPAFSAEVGGRTRAFLKIQDGCDFPCAFCTIPKARGASRSQPPGEILEQARTIAALGYREIVLTGVNVGEYGKRLGTDLLALLRSLTTVDGIERIRISSIEPNLLTREIVDFVLGSDRCCNHFHIPLQSGSDEVLKLMRRRYRCEQYRTIAEYITRQDPDAAIGVDVISGFPGETDARFEETYRFVADLPVAYLHAFTYSERPGTPALGLPDPVEPKVRFGRTERLRLLSLNKRHAFFHRFVGRTMPVLFESIGEHGRARGLSTNYLRVEAPEEEVTLNRVSEVTILGVTEDACTARRASTGLRSHPPRNYPVHDGVVNHDTQPLTSLADRP
jgi:threonylcarbamoyladenosine tRNA methylthiotransferase MtaB